MLCHSVEGHLDRYHRLIVCRFTQHFKERFHALKRIGKQLIFLSDLCKNRFPAPKLGGFLRDSLLKKEFRLLTQNILELKQERQFKRGIVSEHILLFYLQIIAERIHDISFQIS